MTPGSEPDPRMPKRWAGPELELAARADLTALQVANMTGRSAAAVRTARRNLRIDPRKQNLAGVSYSGESASAVEASVESWGKTIADAQAMLREQMCPICDTGPWRSPLNHVSRAHGIDYLTMRDICGFSMREKVTDPAASAAWAENGKRRTEVLAANLDKKRRPARRTRRAKETAGVGLRKFQESDPEAMAALRAGFRERMASPEARAKWDESMKRVRAERVYTPEQRARFVERMGSAEAEAKRAAYHAARRREACSVDGCDSPHTARGYCNKHWRKWRLYGDPLGKGKLGKPRALTATQERQALKMIAEGMSQRSVGEHFGCSQTAIGRLVRRQESD